MNKVGWICGFVEYSFKRIFFQTLTTLGLGGNSLQPAAIECLFNGLKENQVKHFGTFDDYLEDIF